VAGKDFVVVQSPSKGKSLVFNILAQALSGTRVAQTAVAGELPWLKVHPLPQVR
jgi:hypothetical protein